MSKKEDPLERLEKIRQEVYGDPFISHTAIGYVWRGILQNRFHELIIPPIPADLVAEMLAGFKITRAARPSYHQDSYDDAQVYTKFGKRFKEGK